LGRRLTDLEQFLLSRSKDFKLNLFDQYKAAIEKRKIAFTRSRGYSLMICQRSTQMFHEVKTLSSACNKAAIKKYKNNFLQDPLFICR
jgi:hypothetical protein